MTTTTWVLQIPLPLVAITAVLVGIALYYLCCCDKKSRKAKTLRMRQSRRKRGRYPDGQPTQNPAYESNEESPELDAQTSKHAEAMGQALNEVTLTMPEGDEPPPPYHPGPPPEYYPGDVQNQPDSVPVKNAGNETNTCADSQ